MVNRDTKIPEGAYAEMMELARNNGYDKTKNWKNQALRDMAANSRTLRSTHQFQGELSSLFGKMQRAEKDNKHGKNEFKW